MRLQTYLKRINYTGSTKATKETLFALHEAHLKTIAYENLDIHTGKHLSLDVGQIYKKIVKQKRGGWCFEMNSLFAWALKKMRFKVSLLAGAVNHKERGDTANFGHLLLLVKLESLYIADVGFGDGFLLPLELKEGEHKQAGLTYYLENLSQDRWRFHNHKEGAAKSYDFELKPRKIAEFADKCFEMQSSAESGFVKTMICQKFTEEGIRSLRGLVLKDVSAHGVSERTLLSEEEYIAAMASFDLGLRRPKKLFKLAQKQHETWMQTIN